MKSLQRLVPFDNIFKMFRVTLSLSITDRFALFSILRSSSSVLNSVSSTWTISNVLRGTFFKYCKILKSLEKDKNFTNQWRFIGLFVKINNVVLVKFDNTLLTLKVSFFQGYNARKVNCICVYSDTKFHSFKVIMQGKLIAVAYTLHTYWN